MKKALFQKNLASFLLGFGVLAIPISNIQAQANDTCSKELLLAYFPESFVRDTMKKFDVPQDQWEGIAKDLAAKDKDVVKEVEDKAAKLTPNPLKDRSPDQRQAAVKIFRESLFDIFSGVLKSHGISDQKQIQAMLADIQEQKAKNFAQCMEKQKALFNQEKSGQPSQSTSPSLVPSIPSSGSNVKKDNGSVSLADESENSNSAGKDDSDRDDSDQNDSDKDEDKGDAEETKATSMKSSKPAPKSDEDSSKEFTLNYDDEYPDEVQDSDHTY